MQWVKGTTAGVKFDLPLKQSTLSRTIAWSEGRTATLEPAASRPAPQPTLRPV